MAAEAEKAIRYRVGPLASIPENGRLLVWLGELEVGVFNVHGVLRAYESRCAHQGGPVCRGDIVPRFEEPIGPGGVSEGVRESPTRLDIACPWHGWEYDLLSGENVADPRRRLRPLRVSVEGEDVYVIVPEESHDI